MAPQLCRSLAASRPIGEARQDLRLRRVGLEVVDHRQVLLLFRPVVEGHGPVRLHMAQQALDIHRHLAVPGCLGKEGTVEVAVHQAGEVIDLGLDIRQLIEPKGIAHPMEVQARFSLSAVKYWLRMEQVA